MRQSSETKRALIVVRTYPSPTEHGVESSCTAAITEAGEWLRLYPVRYRYLPADKQFSKYQWVDIAVSKSSDPRPESYAPDHDSIEILGAVLPTANAWRARKEIILPLMAPSLCHLQRGCDENGCPTLGLFKPKRIDEFRIIDSPEPHWTPKQLALLRQQHMFEESPKQELEKIPFYFYYYFKCADPSCNGHRLSCTDWEMGESYRKWRREYGNGWEEKFREKYEAWMTSQDLHFFVGTMQQYPCSWIIIGLFYPPVSQQGEIMFSL